MVKSLGVDITEISRIKADLEKFGERFVRRILGPEEIKTYELRRDKDSFLAGRFAAKEACIKALSAYLEERPPLDAIQIINDPAGNPFIKFTADIVARLNGARTLVSISHSRNNAVAVVIFEEDK
ncbi:MAG: holo-ACP synthase [Candidatus Zixiibacteriota bacterium]